jgi:hypothetical protein
VAKYRNVETTSQKVKVSNVEDRGQQITGNRETTSQGPKYRKVSNHKVRTTEEPKVSGKDQISMEIKKQQQPTNKISMVKQEPRR